MKISSLEIENVKRVKAVRIIPSENGLTIIGGRNGEGKTSVLDAIAWALGGAKMEPSNPQRDDSMTPPKIDIQLSNGIRVRRDGKSSTLKVLDPSGQKAGQQLLDSFVSQFALDLPKFMTSGSREKAQTLLQIIGIGDQLTALEQQEKRLYNERHAIGQIAESKAKHAAELVEYADAPAEPVSVSELIQAQQGILAKNGENQAKRKRREEIETKVTAAETLVADLETKLAEAKTNLAKGREALAVAVKTVEQLQDESTAEIEASLANIEAINAQVASNTAKAHALAEADEYQSQYDGKTGEIEAVRKQRMALLENANLPLPELAVQEGELLYKGKRWDCMSSSEQLKVAVAIVRKLKPECEFVLVDKLEQMDTQTMAEFGAWLESENLQVIATRVSTGDECSIVIEDGLPRGLTYADVITGVNGGNSSLDDDVSDWTTETLPPAVGEWDGKDF